MLPMTSQNIQLGSSEGTGRLQKKTLQNKDWSPMNELIFCPLRTVSFELAEWHNAVLCWVLYSNMETLRWKIRPGSPHGIHHAQSHIRTFIVGLISVFVGMDTVKGDGLNKLDCSSDNDVNVNVFSQHRLLQHFFLWWGGYGLIFKQAELIKLGRLENVLLISHIMVQQLTKTARWHHHFNRLYCY